MPRAVLLRLPVHPCSALVINLHPVHPHVPLPCLRIPREHQRKRNKPSAILRPALPYWKIKPLTVVALVHHFFPPALLHILRHERSQLRQFRPHLHLFLQRSPPPHTRPQSRVSHFLRQKSQQIKRSASPP